MINNKKLGRDLFVQLGVHNLLDLCDCYFCNLMWVTGCPALVPVNTSSEKSFLLQKGGAVILIKDYVDTW